MCTLDGCHIVTIEGLGSTHKLGDKLHPIQRTIAENYGSQCKSYFAFFSLSYKELSRLKMKGL